MSWHFALLAAFGYLQNMMSGFMQLVSMAMLMSRSARHTRAMAPALCREAFGWRSSVMPPHWQRRAMSFSA